MKSSLKLIVTSALVCLGILVPVTSAGAATDSALHTVTCAVTASQPLYVSGNVGATGKSACNDSVDARYMTSQLQILDVDGWRNYGNGTETRSTAANVSLYDGAPCSPGTYEYRLKVDHTARHHNTKTTTVYSSQTRIGC